MLQRFVIIAACFVLMGCVSTAIDNSSDIMVEQPQLDSKSSTLDAWWNFFNDPVLDSFASAAVKLSRGNRDDNNLMILDIVQKYVQYRYIQNQVVIIDEYLSDKKDINLIKEKVALENKGVELSFEIAALTKLLPEYVAQLLREKDRIPYSDITPILASDAFVLANVSEIAKARRLFVKNSGGAISFSDTKRIFPDMSVGRFLGVSNDVYLNNNSKWSVSIGAAIKNLDLDALDANYSNSVIYKEFLDEIYDGIINIEHKIISYANMQEQYIVLKKASNKYSKECMGDADICEEAYSAKLAALRAEYKSSQILIGIYRTLVTGYYFENHR